MNLVKGHLRTYAHISVYLFIYISIYLSIYLYLSLSLYIYICICIYIYIKALHISEGILTHRLLAPACSAPEPLGSGRGSAQLCLRHMPRMPVLAVLPSLLCRALASKTLWSRQISRMLVVPILVQGASGGSRWAPANPSQSTGTRAEQL